MAIGQRVERARVNRNDVARHQANPTSSPGRPYTLRLRGSATSSLAEVRRSCARWTRPRRRFRYSLAARPPARKIPPPDTERQCAVAGHDVACFREGGGPGRRSIPPRVLQDQHAARCNERRRRLERADDGVWFIWRVEKNQVERPWQQPARRVRKPRADNSIAVCDGAVLEVAFDQPDGPRVRLDEGDVRRPTAERLDAHRARFPQSRRAPAPPLLAPPRR